jgi:hypothetical protein
MTERTLTLLDGLEKRAAGLAAAPGASEVFRRLLEAARGHAPRVALFLLREGRLKGWGCLGYPVEVAGGFTEVSVAAQGGWLGRVLAEPTSASTALPPGESGPGFGQDEASETVAFPIRLGGSPAAVLVAERAGAEEPWEPAAIVVLATVARLRLELDLAWKRLRGAPAAASRTPVPPASPAREASETALAVAPEPPADPERNKKLDEARRYAKLVATDVRLYNEEAVIAGKQAGDLAGPLWVHLQRGREAFLRRFPDLGDDGMAVLLDAYVQVLAGGDASLLRVSKDLSQKL